MTVRPPPLREWVVRWAKRNPAVAGLAAAGAGVTFAVLVVISGLYWHLLNKREEAETAKTSRGVEQKVASGHLLTAKREQARAELLEKRLREKERELREARQKLLRWETLIRRTIGPGAPNKELDPEDDP